MLREWPVYRSKALGGTSPIRKFPIGPAAKKANKALGQRTSITVHLQPKEALLVEAAAARARVTRHDLVRNLLLAQASESSPILACLAKLIAIHHRLDGAGMLDDDLRAEIVAAVREVTAAARAELAE